MGYGLLDPPRDLSADKGHLLTDSPPITDEDLSNLEVEPGFIDIPFVVSKAQLVEQSSGDERRLTQAEARKLIEMLDRVYASPSLNLLATH